MLLKKHFLLLYILKTVVQLNIFVEIVMLFSGWKDRKKKEENKNIL